MRFLWKYILHMMVRMNDAEANAPDQYSLIRAGVELGGVKIQRGRDQHSLCSGNLQLDNVGGSPANQGPAGGFTEVFEGSRGATG